MWISQTIANANRLESYNQISQLVWIFFLFILVILILSLHAYHFPSPLTFITENSTTKDEEKKMRIIPNYLWVILIFLLIYLRFTYLLFCVVLYEYCKEKQKFKVWNEFKILSNWNLQWCLQSLCKLSSQGAKFKYLDWKKNSILDILDWPSLI